MPKLLQIYMEWFQLFELVSLYSISPCHQDLVMRWPLDWISPWWSSTSHRPGTAQQLSSADCKQLLLGVSSPIQCSLSNWQIAPPRSLEGMCTRCGGWWPLSSGRQFNRNKLSPPPQKKNCPYRALKEFLKMTYLKNALRALKPTVYCQNKKWPEK